ncbi:hypothetical protein ACFUIT_08350 [Streptomyces sp. NPDC057239]|uniref:hypothetical protein n=1 Tax=Streptomyces sp. NPDC057239 TaxID=3346061 RepID=UPI0036288AF6
MRAPSARRIALGALCAVLLAGLAGPAAAAADTAAERDRAASPAALLAQVRTVDGDESGLTPVVDLLKTLLMADKGQVPSGEARKLGDAARDALAKAADEDPVATIGTTAGTATTTEPSPSATAADGTALAVSGDYLTSEELTALREALDNLLDLLRSGTDATTDVDPEADGSTAAEPDTTQEASLVDELLARVHDLVAALLGTEPQASVLPAPADPAWTPLLPGVTFPALTSVLLPSSASS